MTLPRKPVHRPPLRRRRRLRGTLLLLALVLGASAVMRLGPGVAQALEEVPDTPTPAVAATNTVACHEPPEAVLAAFAAREARLAAREAALDEALGRLEEFRHEIAAQLEAMDQAEARLSKTLALAEGASERDLDQLTALYERMKPAEASALFAEMEPRFAAGFLGRMDPGVAAAIMSDLPTSVAHQISVVLAGRHAEVPVQ